VRPSFFPERDVAARRNPIVVQLFPSTPLNTAPDALLELLVPSTRHRPCILELRQERLSANCTELCQRTERLREAGVWLGLTGLGLGCILDSSFYEGVVQGVW